VDDEHVIRRHANARVARWLAAVDRASPRTFEDVAPGEGVLTQAYAESHYWCDEVFLPIANPHDAPGARHVAHRASRRAPDLLRHEYTAAGLALTVTEGRNFFVIEVDRTSLDVLALPPARRRGAIRRVARALFRGASVPSSRMPFALDEGSRFASDHRAEPMLLASWRDRIDGGIRSGNLYFLVYKKVPQRVGFGCDDRWFDERGLTPSIEGPRRRDRRSA
jgi:hypothetical protein